MNDSWFDKIDKYLHGEMSSDEMRLFEAEIKADKELESSFNAYKQVEAGLRLKHLFGKQADALKSTLGKAHEAYLNDPETGDTGGKVIPFRKKTTLKVAVAIAAGIVIIVSSYLIFFNEPDNTRQLANIYIEQNLSKISQEMGPRDSLQLGIAAYNSKDYDKALRLFQSLNQGRPGNRDAKEYEGYVYLVRQEYEKALYAFDELHKLNGKFNRGLFLKAVTLLQRNKEGDITQARELLQQVVHDNAGGKEEAVEWLQKFDY